MDRWLGFSLLLFAIFDGVLATLFFSKFSTEKLKFSLVRFAVFDYYIDLTDVWCLGVIRAILFAGAALGTIWRPQVALKRLPVFGYCMVGYSILSCLYVLAKVLVTTEKSSPTNVDVFYWLQVALEAAVSLITIGLTVLFSKLEGKSRKEKNKGQSKQKTESTENLLDAEESSQNEDENEKTPRKSGIIRLLLFSKPDAHILAIAFVALLVASVADVLSPKYIGEVIAGIVISRNSPEFIRAIVLYAIVSVISLIATGVRGGLFTFVLARLSKRTREKLFASILMQEAAFFDETRTGDIMSRLSADVATMTDTLALNVNIFLRNLVKTIGIAFMMFSLSWRLSVITIAGLPLIAAANTIFGDIYEKLSSAVQDAIARTSHVAEEAISNFKTVFSLAGEKFEQERYGGDLLSVYKLQVRESIVYACSIWSTQFLSLCLTLATLYYGGHLVVTEQLDSKYLVTFLIYQITLGDCLQSMGYVYTGLMQAVGASRKIVEYLDRQPKQKRSGPIEPSVAKGRIEFRNICFSYPTRKGSYVLKDISFTVEPGQVVALVGKSGSGKSSCLALLERFYDPTSGEVFFDGRPVSEYDHAWLHRTIAMVSQEPVLFARSIRENIIFASISDITDDEIIKAANMADASEFVETLPKKYETKCGEKGAQLSAGQKQRIAIARALIRKPDVLLLDEATSALDASAEAAVQETLSRAMAGRTVLVVAHRLSTIRNANRILVLEHGKIVESGTHDELIALDQAYAHLVRKQMNFGVTEDPMALGENVQDSPKDKTERTADVHIVSESMQLATSPYFSVVSGSFEREKIL